MRSIFRYPFRRATAFVGDRHIIGWRMEIMLCAPGDPVELGPSQNGAAIRAYAVPVVIENAHLSNDRAIQLTPFAG